MICIENKTMSAKEYQKELKKIQKENIQKQYRQSLREEKRKYNRKHIETSKLIAVYLFVVFNVILAYAMIAMWVMGDLSYLGVLITDIAAQVITYAIYCMKAYSAKKQSENVKLRREQLQGQPPTGTLGDILNAGAESKKPVPVAGGLDADIEDFSGIANDGVG